MKITVLDGFALNPGDLSWDEFSRFGEVRVFERTPAELTAERIGDSDAILLNKVSITERILTQCPKLRYIGVLATGYNVVDTAAARSAGVTVTNIPAYSTDAVAQHVFALLLQFTNKVAEHSQSVQGGDWTRNPDFCYWRSPLTELAGKTMGIFGWGNIGRQVERIARAFGMKTLVCTRTARPEIENPVTAEELFSRSDVISLHAPLTEQTRGLVNPRTLSLAKRNLILINTARGALADEEAVRAALDEGRIAGYAADVLCDEPMSASCPLLGARNCVLTPHLAWAPLETRTRLLGIAVRNMEAFLSGSPQNVVS